MQFSIILATMLVAASGQLASFSIVGDFTPTARCAWVPENRTEVGFGSRFKHDDPPACALQSTVFSFDEEKTVKLDGKFLGVTARNEEILLRTLPEGAPKSSRVKLQLFGNSVEVLPDPALGIGNNQCLHSIYGQIMVRPCAFGQSTQVKFALPARFFRVQLTSGVCAFADPVKQVVGFNTTSGDKTQCNTNGTLFSVNPTGRMYIDDFAVTIKNDQGKRRLSLVPKSSDATLLTEFSYQVAPTAINSTSQTVSSSLLKEVGRDSAQECLFSYQGSLVFLPCQTRDPSVFTVSILTA